jgi:hypothetical protein
MHLLVGINGELGLDLSGDDIALRVGKNGI